MRNLVDPERLADADERLWIRTAALADPRLTGSLVARDAGVSAVSVTVELPAEEEVVLIPEVARFAHGLAAQVQDRFSGIDVRPVGTVIINNAFTEASFASQKTFLPASLAIMALLLIVLTRVRGGCRNGFCDRVFRTRIDGAGRLGRIAVHAAHGPGPDHRSDGSCS